jgi:hypothetical protein
MYLFGYTNPDILNRQQEETPSDGTHMYNSDVSELVQNEGKTVRAYNYISGLYAL